ncbi:uncharacterized protein LOC6526278 [Drosophila yakuba]|uniref:Uncharacterized protein n=1 Tax=Drosophila yakuba TaxID=7245 RepID=B4P2B6_DROYA|nr:uncharacterized protein LOC6526278 [Drosophila yakuba]EDW87112.1 uncharacterized protein Dyak_GE16692 [Drosophila yakuba]
MNFNANKHTRKLESSTNNWGKTKFKPKKYVKPCPPPVPQSTSTPWQHVKDHIIMDSSEREHQEVDTKDARKFMQQREQNHRRNIIEANRSQATKWESFNDEEPATERKPKLRRTVENLTFEDRNFFRKHLTLGIKLTQDKISLRSAIGDLKNKQKEFESRQNVKSSNTNEAKGSKPFQKMRDNAHPYRKKRQNGRNPFQKGRQME